MHVLFKSYKKYDASRNRAYVYDYDPLFINPKAVTNTTYSNTSSYSYEYKYSYSTSLKYDISNRLNVELDGNFIKVEEEIEARQGVTKATEISWSYGKTKSLTKTLNVNLSAIPSGYVFTPCIVCSAELFQFDYRVTSNTWLNHEQEGDEKATDVSLLRYDPTTFVFTIGVKPMGAQGAPTKYLLA